MNAMVWLSMNAGRFTEATFINPANNWSRANEHAIHFLRALVGNEPFTLKAIDVLMASRPDDTAFHYLMRLTRLPDDKYIQAMINAAEGDKSLATSLQQCIDQRPNLETVWAMQIARDNQTK